MGLYPGRLKTRGEPGRNLKWDFTVTAANINDYRLIFFSYSCLNVVSWSAPINIPNNTFWALALESIWAYTEREKFPDPGGIFVSWLFVETSVTISNSRPQDQPIQMINQIQTLTHLGSEVSLY